MDYDVRAKALASPPASAPQQTYSPAIEVENLGVHTVDVTGQIAIIDLGTGLQVFSSPVSLASLGPGETGNAVAADTWTPAGAGHFYAYGFVTCDHDGNPGNGQLPPTLFDCTGEPTPPPVTVPAHAAQHEQNGSDTLDVEGLPGKLRDGQTPDSHAATHQNGGDDALSVDGLSGRLATPQEPDTHSNTAHNPQMATSAELTSHQNGVAVHTAATNLANRDTTGPETGLVPGTQLVHGTIVPDAGDDANAGGLRADRYYGPVNSVHHAAKHAAGGLDPVAMPGVTTDAQQNKTCTPAGGQITLATCELTAAQAKVGTVCHFMAVGTIATVVGTGQRVLFTLFHQNGGASTPIVSNTYNLAGNTNYTFHIDGMIGIAAALALAGAMHGEVSQVGAPAGEIHADGGAPLGLVAPAATSRFFLAVSWIGGAAGSTLNCSNALGLGGVRL